MKKYIRVCKECKQTFETDGEHAVRCKPCLENDDVLEKDIKESFNDNLYFRL